MEKKPMIPFISGLGSYSGLIVSLGPQNVELIRQGVLKQHTYTLASIYIICDVLLILVGATGVGYVMLYHPLLIKILYFIASACLLYLSFLNYKQFFYTKDLFSKKESQKILSKNKAIALGLMYSLLNPIGILETVIIFGAISSQYKSVDKYFFCLGAIFMTFLWFYGVSFCAIRCYKIFQNPSKQKILYGFIGTILLFIAISIIVNTL